MTNPGDQQPPQGAGSGADQYRSQYPQVPPAAASTGAPLAQSAPQVQSEKKGYGVGPPAGPEGYISSVPPPQGYPPQAPGQQQPPQWGHPVGPPPGPYSTFGPPPPGGPPAPPGYPGRPPYPPQNGFFTAIPIGYIDDNAYTAHDLQRERQGVIFGWLLLLGGIFFPFLWILGSLLPCCYPRSRRVSAVAFANGLAFIVSAVLILVLVPRRYRG